MKTAVLVLSVLTVETVQQPHADPAGSAASLMNRLVGRRTATLVHGMRGKGLKGDGMVTMCIGTGMDVAGDEDV